jgi:hypothetical protein
MCNIAISINVTGTWLENFVVPWFSIMGQLDILRCDFSANAKISFLSKFVCVAYSVLWENQILLAKKIVFLSMTLISPFFFLTVNTSFISLLTNFYFYPQFNLVNF